MNLHDITGTITYNVWLSPAGRNGQVIGQRPTTHHIYRIPRLTPPPLHSPYRGWWSPISLYESTINPTHPICGPLRTQALRQNTYLRPYAHNDVRCPTCLHRDPNARDYWATLQADPWYRLPTGDRIHHPDPVTGL